MNTLYVEREEPWNKAIVVKSTDFFITEMRLIRGVHDFEVKSNYMFASKRLVGEHDSSN